MTPRTAPALPSELAALPAETLADLVAQCVADMSKDELVVLYLHHRAAMRRRKATADTADTRPAPSRMGL